jgi:hypothetical protein
MFTKIMKWLSIMALLLGALLSSSASYRIALELVVCVAAAVVAAQAFRTGKYFWGIGFVAIAVLFNPAVPIAFSHGGFLVLDLVCIAGFLASLAVLQWKPILSVPSITDRTPGSESL